MSVQAIQTIPHARQASKLTTIFRVLKDAGAGWMKDNAMRLSAALSLYTILSLAPLLVITIKIVSMVWRNQDYVRTHTMEQLDSLMGPDAAKALQKVLENGAVHGSGVLATIISTAVLLFSATGVFIELQDSMNTIWGVEAKPHQGLWGFIRNRLLSLAMVLGIAFLLLVSMFVSTVLTTLVQSIAGDASWVAVLADIVVSLVFVTLLFAAIFKFLPDVKLQWKHVWLGALITSALFMLGKYGLAVYFKYATPTSAFGAAGSLAAVLIWVYYSGFILFFGAEFTKAWALHHGHCIIPEDIAVKVGAPPRPAIKALAGVDLRHRPPGSFRSPTMRQAAHDLETSVGHISPPSAAGSFAVLAGAFATGIGAGWLLWKDSRKLPLAATKAARITERLHAMEEKLRGEVKDDANKYCAPLKGSHV